MKHLCRYVVIFLTVVALSGCSCGNGEGYAGRCGGNGLTAPPDDSNPGTAGTNDPTYFYWRDNAYTCVDPGTGLAIASYRNLIVMSGGQATLQGDRCGNGAGAGDIHASLDFSPSGSYLGYVGGIYEMLSGDPPLGTAASLETQAWCQTADLTASSGREIFVRKIASEASPTVVIYSYGGPLGTTTATFAVTRSQDSTTRTYDTTGFRLVVTRGPSAGDPAKHDGVLDDAMATSLSVSCRLLP